VRKGGGEDECVQEVQRANSGLQRDVSWWSPEQVASLCAPRQSQEQQQSITDPSCTLLSPDGRNKGIACGQRLATDREKALHYERFAVLPYKESTGQPLDPCSSAEEAAEHAHISLTLTFHVHHE
jgi:hypothetical protein